MLPLVALALGDLCIFAFLRHCSHVTGVRCLAHESRKLCRPAVLMSKSAASMKALLPVDPAHARNDLRRTGGLGQHRLFLLGNLADLSGIEFQMLFNH